MHHDRIVRDVEVQVDFGATRMSVRRHGVPDAPWLELRHSHHELRTLRATGMDVLGEPSLVRALRRAEVRRDGGISTDARCWMTGMRGITHDVETSRPCRVVALERDLFAAATDIQYVLTVHGVSMSVDDDGPVRRDVQNPNLPPLSKV